MYFCANSRVIGLWLQVALVAAICFATACSRHPNNADQNNGDRKSVDPNDSGQKNVDEKHDDYARLAGTKAGEERLFSELQMKFCWCPAGKFTMGSPVDEAGRREDEDQVNVTLTQGFWLGKTEVTQGQWKAVMSTTCRRRLPALASTLGRLATSCRCSSSSSTPDAYGSGVIPCTP